MNHNFIKKVLSDMSCVLNNYQIEKLKNTLNHCLYGKKIVKNCDNELNVSIDYVSCFLSSKKLEGCSARTISYYKITIDMMYKSIKKGVKLIDTNDIRNYLSNYQKKTIVVM